MGTSGSYVAGAVPPSGLFPISEWNGAHSSSFHPDMIDTVSSCGVTFYARLLVPAGKPITKAAVAVSGAAASPSATDCYAVYDATGALLGQSPGSNTLLTATGLRWANMAAVIPAAAVDRFVWVTVFAANPAGLNIRYKNGAGDIAGSTTARRAFFDSPASVPASINPVTTGTTSLQYIPFYMLA